MDSIFRHSENGSVHHILAIRQAVDLKDLHSKYFVAIRKVPHYGDRFSEEYEAKRKVLSGMDLNQ